MLFKKIGDRWYSYIFFSGIIIGLFVPQAIATAVMVRQFAPVPPPTFSQADVLAVQQNTRRHYENPWQINVSEAERKRMTARINRIFNEANRK